MTIFTIIWIVIIGYCFTRKGMLEMTSATLIFMTFQCANVIEMGDVGIGPQVLTSLMYILKYLVYSKGKLTLVKSKRLYFMNFLLLALFAEVVFSSVLNGVAGNVFTKLLQLFSYIVCYLCMRRSLKLFSEEELYSIVRRTIVLVVAVGFIQWATTMWLPFMRPILKPLLYNDNSTNIYFNYNDVFHNKRIYGTFMEPSYLACVLVGSFYYLFSFRQKLRDNIVLMIIIILEIIFTTSSTAYGAFLIIGMLFIIRSKQIPLRWKIATVFVGIVCLAILYFGFYDLLDAVIFSKLDSGSGRTRARWNKEAFDAYLSSPIYGVGYKNVRGSSIFYSVLGELGLIGFTLYIAFIIQSIIKLFFNGKKDKSIGYYGAMYAVSAAVACQFIACPDLDMCSMWLALYILAIYEGKNAHYSKG